jgi:hypothetical protein
MAADIPIRIAGSTETQIVINYTATSSAACAISATDNNNGPSVNDLDPTKFPNSNSDLARTAANGFRWPTLVNGLNRKVFLGGHDEVKQGSDGRWYSTPLQVNSDHTITVACNGGADTGVTHASTHNLPLGSTYPELPIPTPGSPLGGMPQPTIDWSVAGRIAQYIDPITGVLVQRITGATDNFDDTQPLPMTWYGVVDLDGAWTNPGNFITSKSSSTLASTSTPNAPLFAVISGDPPYSEVFTDILITPYGSASSSSVISEWCLSTDSGQTCANYTPIDVTFNTSAQSYPVIPSSTISANFSGWGGMAVAFGNYDLHNVAITGVSASGSTVTMDTPAAVGFNLDRKPGTKFYLSSCSTGANTLLTVSQIISNSSITVQETGLNLQHCSFQELAAGVRVILKNAGTLNLSLTAQTYQTRGATPGSNGSIWLCGTAKVNDIQTDCDGNVLGAPTSGYLCGMPGLGVYLIQDNGRMCMQSNLYHANPGIHLTGVGQFTDPSTFIAPAFGGNTYKVAHIPNDYHEVQIDDVLHTQNDNFAYTDISSTNPTAAIIAGGGPTANALNTGLWPSFGVQAPIDNGSGHAILQWNSSQGGDQLCMLAWTDAVTGQLLSSLPLFGVYPFSYSTCHFSAQGVSGYSFTSVSAASSQLGPVAFSPTGVTLGGPFVSQGAAVARAGTFSGWSISVTAATNASPVVLTSTNNNLDNLTGFKPFAGAQIQCSGGSGAWAAINGTFYAHRIDNNTFSLYADPQGATPLNASSFGTLTGAISCSMNPPIYNLILSGISNVSGHARAAVNTSSQGYNAYFPSTTLVARDGDPIALTSHYLTDTTQYYAKVSCSGCSANQFDIYLDKALTQPASYTQVNGTPAGTQFAVFAETCPDPATLSLPGPLYEDTGIGTSAARKVRCVTIRLNTEACSDYPHAGEQAKYPCASDPTNPNRSMLHQINVGDGFSDLSHFGNNHEILMVLKVDRSAGENQIDVTLLRSYGDDPVFGWRGATGPTDFWALQHSPGWTLWAENTIAQISINPGPPIKYAVLPGIGVHYDIVPGSAPGRLTTAIGYQTGVPDDAVDETFAQFSSQPFTQNHNSFPFFASSLLYTAANNYESYPSKRIRYNQTPIGEQSWKGDWMAINAAFGNGRNNGDGIGWTRTLTNIAGTSYDPGRATSIVYKIPTINTAIDIKIAPVLMTDVPHTYFVDKSGPASLITDADRGKFCVAFLSGECRPGSAPGDVFFAGAGFYDAGQCLANDSTLGSPCAFGLWPGAGWAVQVRQTPMDTNATGVRRLTMGWWLTPNHYSFSNWITTPDGKWGLFSNNPIGGRARHGEYGAGMHWFAMKLPPWPVTDSTNRTAFVNIPVKLSGVPGDRIRIAFGYGENGNPANFYCVARQETCWTSASPSSASPFLFAGETQIPTACDNGCSVAIPAIAGRILFYEIERRNGSNVTALPLQAVAVP